MESKLIPAKPFMWQFKRVTGEDFVNLHHIELSSIIDAWFYWLYQPFKPDEIPDILEGWSCGEIICGHELKFKNHTYDCFDDNIEAQLIKNDGVDFWTFVIMLPKTLNDFLSDLHRAGIDANFRAEWIAERGLM